MLIDMEFLKTYPINHPIEVCSLFYYKKIVIEGFVLSLFSYSFFSSSNSRSKIDNASKLQVELSSRNGQSIYYSELSSHYGHALKFWWIWQCSLIVTTLFSLTTKYIRRLNSILVSVISTFFIRNLFSDSYVLHWTSHSNVVHVQLLRTRNQPRTRFLPV